MKRLLLSLLALLILSACEPIQVSVSKSGAIAFTRSEGVFSLDSKSGKVSPLFWVEAANQCPAITRWSEDGSQIAYTLKEKKDASSTDIWVAKKGEAGKKLTTVSSVITQMEWSPDGKYISYITGGADSDLGVADIYMADVATGMTKKVIANVSEHHRWVDGNTLLVIKLNAKVENFDGRFVGLIEKVTLSGEQTAVTDTFVTVKEGVIDLSSNGEILFTSLSLDLAAKSDSAITGGLYRLKGKKAEKVLDKEVLFVEYTPDGKNAALITQVEKVVDYSTKKFIDLEVISAKNETEVVRKGIANAVSVDGNNLNLIPAWLDNTNLLFFNMNANYGSSLQGISLWKVDTKSKKLENLQPKIDTEIDRIVMEKGGY